jgi:TP901 family phage tail tape measure protein
VAVTVAELNAKLTAEVDQFKRAMKDAEDRMGGLEQAAKRSSDGAAAGADKVSRAWSSVGSTLTKSVTLPAVAAGGAALKLGLDFEESFAHIEGLVGVTGAELEGMRDKTLALGHATGQGPEKLADALYFVTSAGIKGDDAMDALEMSAKAASAGLGSTAEVADAVTSAMSGYAKQGLTAADATDVLTNTVKEGKIEADALAGAIGQVIPVASVAGVEFHEAGAAIAVLSRTGADASESVTQLRSFIDAVIAPSKGAAKALAEVGLTTDGLRKVLAEKGVLATMQLLRDRFGENTDAIKKWSGRIEAMNALLGVTGQESAEVARVFESLANSTGITDQAFDVASKTAGFKLKQAFADLKVAAVQTGDAIVPMAAGVGSAVGGLVQGFTDLEPPVRNAGLAVAGIAAAAGPAIKAAQGVQDAWSKASTVISGLGMFGTAGAGLMFGGITAGAALFAYQLTKTRQEAAEARARQEEYRQALLESGDAAVSATDRNLKLADSLIKVQGESEGAGDAVEDQLAGGFVFAEVQAKGLADELADAGLTTEQVAAAARDGGKGLTFFGSALSNGTGEARSYLDATSRLTDGQQSYARALADAVDAGRLSREEAVNLNAVFADLAGVSDDITDSLQDQARAKLEEMAASDQALAAQIRYLEGSMRSADGAVNYAAVLGNVTNATTDTYAAADAATLGLGDLAASMGGAGASATTLDGTLDTLAGGQVETEEATRAHEQALKDMQKAEDDARKAHEDRVLAALDLIAGVMDVEKAERAVEKALIDEEKAQRDYDTAVQEHGPTSIEAREAALRLADASDGVKDALYRAAAAAAEDRVKQLEAAGAHVTAEDKARLQKEELQRLAGTLEPGSPLRAHLEGLIAKIDEIPEHKTIKVTLDDAGVTGQIAAINALTASGVRIGGERAGGGPVQLGTPYIVGEEGAEVFVPNQSGWIIPHDLSMQMLNSGSESATTAVGVGGGGMGGDTYNITVNGLVGGARDIAQAIRRELVALERSYR